MKKIFSKIAKAKNQGWLRTIEVYFNQLVPPWVFRYSKGNIYDFSIDKLRALAAISPEDRLVAKCLDADAPPEARLQLREFTWNVVPIETTTNDLGYAIYDADDPTKLLAGLWAGVGSFVEDNLGVQFRFADHQAWLYCAFVDPEARGRGIYKRLISFVAADLQQRGFTQLTAIIQPWNRISKLMHEKQSNGICGGISAIRVGPFVWLSRSGNVDVDKRLVIGPQRNPASVSIGDVKWPNEPYPEAPSRSWRQTSRGKTQASRA